MNQTTNTGPKLHGMTYSNRAGDRRTIYFGRGRCALRVVEKRRGTKPLPAALTRRRRGDGDVGVRVDGNATTPHMHA